MKFCPGCQKNRENFYIDKSIKDGLSTYCKICTKEKCNARYQNNESYRTKALERKNKRREEIKRFIFDYLSTHSCVDCSESDPRCLEFDHVRGVKEFQIADATRNLPSIERLQQELDKCEVRCANCHQKKTAKDFKHYTYLYMIKKNG